MSRDRNLPDDPDQVEPEDKDEAAFKRCPFHREPAVTIDLDAIKKCECGRPSILVVRPPLLPVEVAAVIRDLQQQIAELRSYAHERDRKS